MTEETRQMSAENAAIFHKLHEELLILPNAWDAASARIVQEAGAKAIATSSAAVAWAQGFADGHHFPIANLIAVVEATARAVSIPITCDAEGGYSDDPKDAAENVGKLIDAGAVGINLEDGKWPHELHLKKIEAIRAVAEKKGVNLYINARTDVILKQLVPAAQHHGAPRRALGRQIARARRSPPQRCDRPLQRRYVGRSRSSGGLPP
jgi:2-methylisocitrate lyase-like PEP mutase family enzyme